MSDQYQNICFDDTLSMSSHSNDNYGITNEPQQHTESPFASPLEHDQAYHLSPYTPYTPFLPTTTPTATPRISGLPLGSNLSDYPQFQDFGIFGGDDETIVPQPTENLIYEQPGVTSPAIGSELLGIYSSPALTTTLNTPVTEFIPCTPACPPIASVYNTPLFSVLNTPAIPQTPYFDNTPLWEPSPVFSNVATPISVRIDNHLPPSVPSSYPQEIDWSITEDSFKPEIELQFAKLESITYSEDQPNFVVMSNILPDLDSAKCSPEVQSTIDSGSESTITTQVGDNNVGQAQTNARSTTPRPIRPRPPDDEDSQNQMKRHKNDMEEDDDDTGTGEKKQFACSKCDKRFSRKFNMQTHELTHDTNRIKPFACEHPGCASRFTRKHDLKRHVNGIHKGEKVHLCTACKKPFSRKDAWKRHQSGCTR
ncbi:6043_t:CDS:2 [Paraglomus occultum]|uniref:6043_t:CDS:1 n=1 Tax=Paraglomus occultum TaxID=144539 RepID=A0A9N9ARP4_9GLOM|nr:6043_t:CDS:2 [Paraglomus occultum]